MPVSEKGGYSIVYVTLCNDDGIYEAWYYYVAYDSTQRCVPVMSTLDLTFITIFFFFMFKVQVHERVSLIEAIACIKIMGDDTGELDVSSDARILERVERGAKLF